MRKLAAAGKYVGPELAEHFEWHLDTASNRPLLASLFEDLQAVFMRIVGN